MKHVIIGAGASGISAARTIREIRGDDEIVVISSDEAIYSKCMLHKYISGERDEAGLSFIGDGFFKDNNIRRLAGVTVTGIDTAKKQVQFDGGSESYDRLLIATGSRNVIPPVGNLRSASNVYGLRELNDAKTIREKAGQANDIVIIGAGLAGLDAAYALVELGKKPVLVDIEETVLAKNLDSKAASVYQRKFEEAGCEFRLGRKVSDTINDDSGVVTALVLDNGDKLPCDFIISTAGVRPAAEILKDSGASFQAGINVDEFMATEADGIYIAGDVAGISGIWPNAVKQGEVAAMNMCGVKTVYDDAFAQKNTTNFFGIVTLSVGQFIPSEGDEVFTREDRSRYEKVIVRNGVPVGVILQGDISHSGFWQYLIKKTISVADIRKPIWKLSFADFYSVKENGEYEWQGVS